MHAALATSGEDRGHQCSRQLIHLQEMTGRGIQDDRGSSQNLATPRTPTLAARNAGSNETAISSTTVTCYVNVTALNYFGETIKSAQASVPFTQNVTVVDVTIAAVPGAQQYNVYASTTTTPYLQAGTSVQSATTYTGVQTANSVGGPGSPSRVLSPRRADAAAGC